MPRGKTPTGIIAEIEFCSRVYKDIDPSSKGVTVVHQLEVNKYFWLRNRKILTKGRYSDWTDWKRFAIHN